jgi:hypothetical protein
LKYRLGFRHYSKRAVRVTVGTTNFPRLVYEGTFGYQIEKIGDYNAAANDPIKKSGMLSLQEIKKYPIPRAKTKK